MGEIGKDRVNGPSAGATTDTAAAASDKELGQFLVDWADKIKRDQRHL